MGVVATYIMEDEWYPQSVAAQGTLILTGYIPDVKLTFFLQNNQKNKKQRKSGRVSLDHYHKFIYLKCSYNNRGLW